VSASDVKATLNARAEEFAQWLFPAGNKRGHEWKIGSLAGEAGDSLGICIEGSKVGVFCDFATGDKGDNLIELYSQAKQCSFRDALYACAQWLGINHVTAGPRVKQPSTLQRQPGSRFPTDDDLLSGEQCLDAVRMVTALREDAALCERIAAARGWRVETIQRLTREPTLGWHEGKLAFIYETGVKFRWREKGERVIRWAFGKPWIWRAPSLLFAQTVYLCEGETDAISLIDAGLDDDNETVVVAVPSASTFSASWAESFRDKHLILVLDADTPGKDASERILNLLRGCVRSLKQLDWEAFQYASAS
jgi:hypothetical protein